MIQSPQSPRLNFLDRWSRPLVIGGFFLLAVAYFIYLRRQYVDIFFEGQFLHIDFLRGISQGHLTAKEFFTVFGEHLFPGYNLVLAVNYYLFGIWGGFDSIIYAISLLITAVVVGGVIYRSNPSFKTVITLITAFLLLSTTNNPQSGMGLAAAIGVMLFVMSTGFVGVAFDNNTKRPNLFAYIAIAFAILFFLGGYAIGAVAAIFLLLIVWVARNRIIDFKVVTIFGTVFMCVIMYVILVSRYSALLDNRPTGATFNLRIISQFALLMAGASLIGKAFFEHTQQLWPYYFCGSILLFWSACLFKEFIQKPIKGRMFVLAIATYSIVNVLVASLFRFRNGLDGALGQWYNTNTHFIAVAVCYYLFNSLRTKRNFIDLTIRVMSIGVILYFAAIGYYYDWKKSVYVPAWEEQFVAQAPVLLAFPDSILDKNNPFNTMLWNYPQAKAGVDFLYSKNLWIFRGKSPLTFGLSDDGWMEASRPVTIVCPTGSKKVSFRAWRPDGWRQSIISARYTGKRDLVPIKNGETQLEFMEGKPVVLLEGSDLGKSHPASSNGDVRQLVAIVGNVSCELGTGQVSQSSLK